MHFDERDLYTGLAALHWATISQTDSRWDQAFYQRIVQQRGGRALEIGCGAGRLLLAYLESGLQVEGVDLSGEMLAVCREQAAALGLQPVLYEQPMQAIDLPHAYQTIYIPCGSFICVMDREAAVETLRRCHAHLEPGGVLAFNIYLADYDYSRATPPGPFPGPWKPKSEKQLPGQRRLVISYRETGIDPVEQIWMEQRRYQLYDGDQLLKEEIHDGQGRWYFRNELLLMLQRAGFSQVAVKGDYTDEEFSAQHTRTMVFLATKDRAG
ncbi:MAG TPA: methyltransferase domain-containing protein [Herpetosiphonaceae bacterium]